MVPYLRIHGGGVCLCGGVCAAAHDSRGHVGLTLPIHSLVKDLGLAPVDAVVPSALLRWVNIRTS